MSEGREELQEKYGEEKQSDMQENSENRQTMSHEKEGQQNKSGDQERQHTASGNKKNMQSSAGKEQDKREQSEKQGEENQSEDGEEKTKTVKYKTNTKGKEDIDKIAPQLDQIDEIVVWTLDPEDPEAILTIVMDKDGDVAVIETMFSEAGFEISPCPCDEE